MAIRKEVTGILTRYFGDRNVVTVTPSGPRRLDGWAVSASWTEFLGGWYATRREAEAAARELLDDRQAHVAAIRRRAEAVLKAAGLSCEPLLDALTEEFSK